jgi:hypothetical protein
VAHVENNIWTRLEKGLAKAPAQPVATPPEGGKTVKEVWRDAKRKVRWLDLLAALIWAYGLIKVFVIDLDRKLLEGIGHGAQAVLDYRIFFYVAVLVALVAALRKHRALLLLGYFLFFPLIVFVWKIPAFFIRRRSFVLFLGATHAIVNLIGGFRYHVISKGLAAFAAFFILATDSRGLIALSISYVGFLILWSYGRLFRNTFSVSTFISAQRQAINRATKSDRLRSLTALGDEYAPTALTEYDYSQATQVAVKISLAVTINRVLYLWAYQLDRYRRQVFPALMFNGLSFVWLFIGTICGLSLINFGLAKITTGQFTFDNSASLLAMTLFSFASLHLQEAGGVHAAGGITQAVQLSAAFLGLIVIAGFVLNVIITARRERSEGELQGLVTSLKLRAREQEAQFRAEYAVSVEEAYQRLVELRAGMAFLLASLMSSIPEDFFDAARDTG